MAPWFASLFCHGLTISSPRYKKILETEWGFLSGLTRFCYFWGSVLIFLTRYCTLFSNRTLDAQENQSNCLVWENSTIAGQHRFWVHFRPDGPTCPPFPPANPKCNNHQRSNDWSHAVSPGGNGGTWGNLLLGMCRWPFRAPTPL